MQATIYSNAPNATYAYTKQGFFRRQFDCNGTKGQFAFDVVFGIFLPMLCFIFDPLFFHTWLIDDALFGGFQLFAYGVAGIEIITLLLWLLQKQLPQGAGKIYGSLLLAGGLFSFALGIILLPFTIIGLMFLIGILGFVPFFTGFVFWRNGIRALKQAGWGIDFENVFLAIVLGGIFALGAPFAFQLTVWHSTEKWIQQISEDDPKANLAIKQMKAFNYITGYTERELRKACSRDRRSMTRTDRLDNAFKEITGKESFERNRDY